MKDATAQCERTETPHSPHFYWSAAQMLFLALTVALAACSAVPSQEAFEAERQALMDTDREFARESAANGAEGWAGFFLEDGTMFPDEGVVRGRDDIRDIMEQVFVQGGPLLTWQPDVAHVSAGLDLGYTIGKWQFVAGTDSVISSGNYLTVWSKDDDGSWKVAVDIGNDDPSND